MDSDVEKEVEQHARDFLCWYGSQATAPEWWGLPDLLDAYEELVEREGATRTERRRAIARIDFPLRGAWWWALSNGVVGADFNKGRLVRVMSKDTKKAWRRRSISPHPAIFKPKERA